MPALSRKHEPRTTFFFVDFYAEWCAPCKVLEDSIFHDPEVQKALGAYVFVKVDTDEFPAAGEHFHVAALPTLLAR